MSRSRFWAAAALTMAIPMAACENSTSPTPLVDPLLASAFSTAPAGYGEVTSSFSPDGGAALPFLPGRSGPMGMMGGPMGGGPRGGRGPMAGGPMGGGLGPEFLGGVAAERGGHRGPFGASSEANCAFANGQVSCTNTRNGLTISSVHVYKTANGTVQERPDSTTDYHSVSRTVTGTIERREGSTATVNHSSSRVVTGLTGEQRTVNGESTGQESASGTNREGKAFTAQRTAADKTENLIIPNDRNRATYPVSGKITRTMTATVTVDGETRSSSRTEIITYNGTATATIVITQDGETKTCTMPLPRGRVECGN